MTGLTLDSAFALGIDHLEAGRPDDARSVFAAILKAAPTHPHATYLFGVSLLQSGRAADALAPLAQARDADPANWRIGLALAGALDNLGRLQEAATALRRVAVIAPDTAQAPAALSALMERLGDPPRHAAVLVRRAVAGGLAPADPAICFNLARTLIAGGGATLARRLLRLGLVQAPAMPELMNALAAADLDAMRVTAEPAARRAVALAPDRPDYRYNLAGCLALRGATDAASAEFRQTLALNPAHAAALNNLGLVLRDQSLIAAALSAHRRALSIEPGTLDIHRNLLAALLYAPEIEESSLCRTHLEFGRTIAVAGSAIPAPAEDGERRPTVAYLSSDFRDHPVGRSLEPVIAAHDRSRIRVALYMQRHRPDETMRRFEAMADLVRDVTGLDDAEAAALMRADGIDVLVVVAGRYDRNRPGVAAFRAAPVQVSLHDTATSGIAEMDYLIADPVLAPRHGKERFVERVVRLPRFVVQTALPDLPTARSPGAAPVFGSFNAPAKLSDPTLALWATLLRHVPGSRLVLKSKNLFASRTLAGRVAGFFAAEGIDLDRLDFRSAVEPLARHLENYRDIDVALDPFPFNGSTTTFEALWMGVPVVTLKGQRMVGRWSASMLHAIGQDGWIAPDEERYIEIAAGLGRDPAALSQLRTSLRDRLRLSSLMDGKGRARQLERAYLAFWRKFRRPRP